MTSIIDSLKAEGVLVLYHDYRTGHCNDLSGNGNDGTPAATTWASNGIQFTAAGEVTVADAAELQLTEGTLVVLLDGLHTHTGDGQVLIAKRDVGGTNYYFYIANTPAIRLYDGANHRNINTDLTSKKCFAINLKNGETPEGFVDGLSIGNFSGAVAISVDNAPITIGNLYTDNNPMNTPMQAALIINRKLTATEHSQLYAELTSLTFPRKSAGKALPTLDDEEVVDGNMEAAGVGDWTVGSSATLTKEDNNVLGGSQVLRVAFNGAAWPYARQGATMVVGTKYRITGWARGDGANAWRIYNPTQWLHYGTISTTWQPFDVTFTATDTSFRLYSISSAAGWAEFDNVSVREVLDDETQFKTDWNAQVSEANVAAGYIENTPFQRGTGTWRVSTETINGKTCKVLECIAAGIAYIDARLFSGDPTQDAYGTWEWWFNHANGSLTNMVFQANLAGTSGYMIQALNDESLTLFEIPAMTTHFATVAGYISHSTWYKTTVTRRQSDGMFTAYLDDTIISVTAGANPIDDATHTTSEVIAFDIDAGDKIAIADISGDTCLRKLHGVIEP